jgi:hypothetical protein
VTNLLNPNFTMPGLVNDSVLDMIGNTPMVDVSNLSPNPDVRILVCADDDFATLDNPGVDAASAAAMAVGGAWVAPVFADARQVDLRRRVGAVPQADRDEYRRAVGEILQSAGHAKATDFNDLHQVEGLVLVRQQIEAMLDARIIEKKWTVPETRTMAHVDASGVIEIIDHNPPVIDPEVGWAGWDSFIERLFCEEEHLRALCTDCHKAVTDEEKQIAKDRRQKEKANG